MKTIDIKTLKRLRNTFKKWKKTNKGIAVINALYQKQWGKCAVCLNQTKFYEAGDSVEDITIYAEVDHIIALAVGGTNDPSNLQILCGRCNSRKGIN